MVNRADVNSEVPHAHGVDMSSDLASAAISVRTRDRRASDSVANSILALPHTGLLPVEVARPIGIRREKTHV